MITTAIEPSIVNTKIVYFGKLLKSLISEELNSNISQIEYPDDFQIYMDSEPLLSLPDVIIIEVDENDNCFEQVRYLKAHPFLQGLIIILLGIKDDNDWRKKALQLKVDDYYTFPFPLQDFYERINFLVKFKLIKPKISDLNQKIEGKFEVSSQKRIFDIVLSAISLFLLAPLFIMVAVIIRLESKGKVIYKSKRVGAGYKIFDFYKFRSMRKDADTMLHTIKDLNQYAKKDENFSDKTAFMKFKNDPRITQFGSFLRKTSIDELPQLINVLIGDMSIVGNRPLPLYEAEKLTTNEWATRFIGPAGLTGLWQISKRGQKEMSERERKELDNYYANNYSIFLDLKIILKTFPALIQKEQV